MKAHKSLLWLLLLTAFVMACKKEYSYEKGIFNPSSGSLQSGTTGDCLGSVVGGTYKADISLADSNYVDVKVDVTTAGSYTISTDTINGFYFSGGGFIYSYGRKYSSFAGKRKTTDCGDEYFYSHL